MAPPRKRDTSLGHNLRAAREHLGLRQAALARLVHVSPRQVSRWENGRRPTVAEAERLIKIFDRAPASLYNALGTALGFELVDDDAPTVATAAPEVVARSPEPVASSRPRNLADPALRSALDAVVLASSEVRDVLPRHLRAFGVALLGEVARLGLTPSEAVALLAPKKPERE